MSLEGDYMSYITDYKIYTPQLKSGDRKRISLNENLGNITYDYNAGVLKKFGLQSVSFSFFILWENGLTGSLNKEIWLKKEISIRCPGSINLNDADTFDRIFFENEPLSFVESKLRFFSYYGLHATYIIIRDLKGVFHLKDGDNVAILVKYDLTMGKFKKTPITLKKLQSILVKYSNRRMRINKPLNYYETDLEKYLQESCERTGALFPGDCDMLLYDCDNICKYIIEFKKTTYYDKTPIEEQSFLKYMNRDRNKYTRLNILRNYFSDKLGNKVPFVAVFYSLREKNKIKIEFINQQLALENSCVFPISSDPISNQELIIQTIEDICR